MVLYFYPKDETPGCTKEACAFRDAHAKFVEAGAVVLGVSIDSGKAHDKFIEKHRLPFTLLADESKAIVRPTGYGARNGLWAGPIRGHTGSRSSSGRTAGSSAFGLRLSQPSIALEVLESI